MESRLFSTIYSFILCKKRHVYSFSSCSGVCDSYLSLTFHSRTYVILEFHARGCWLLNLLWKPFHPLRYKFKKAFNIRGSIINAFATFICLSYFKILMTSFDIGSSTALYSSSGGHPHRLYFNSSIRFKDATNSHYFVLAAVTTTLFCILPLLVILICPTKVRKFRCLYRCKFTCEVIKIFQKHFKDGSNGTYDYRSFSGLYFAFRILFLLTNYFSYTFRHYLRCLISLLVAFLIAYLHPYKDNFYNYLDSFWFAEQTVFTLTLLYQVYVSNNTINLVILGIGATLPPLYSFILALYWCGKTLRSHLSCFHRILPRCCRAQDSMRVEEELPDRLENSSEYRRLLPE